MSEQVKKLDVIIDELARLQKSIEEMLVVTVKTLKDAMECTVQIREDIAEDQPLKIPPKKRKVVEVALHKETEKRTLRRLSNRREPALMNVRQCPDCLRTGAGSKSYTGVMYWYCRNSKCPGRGSSRDRYIGWSPKVE